jgi:hypothetical protein
MNAHDRLLSEMELVAILRHHPRLQDQLLPAGDDEHGRLGGDDHSAHGVHRELMNRARTRRATPLELILGRTHPTAHHPAWTSRNSFWVSTAVVTDLDDLQPDFGNLARSVD